MFLKGNKMGRSRYLLFDWAAADLNTSHEPGTFYQPMFFLSLSYILKKWSMQWSWKALRIIFFLWQKPPSERFRFVRPLKLNSCHLITMDIDCNHVKELRSKRLQFWLIMPSRNTLEIDCVHFCCNHNAVDVFINTTRKCLYWQLNIFDQSTDYH